MGMSTWVCGFRAPDERWRTMKNVWEACESAGIDRPKEVEDFFDGEPPDDSGVKVNIKNTLAVREYTDDSSQGYEIFLDKLPKGLTSIRFVNSW